MQGMLLAISPGESPFQATTDRYSLARFPDGGVVVDLVTGNYFRLNSTAATICEALLGERSEGDARSRLCADLQVPMEEAERLVSQVGTSLQSPQFHGPIQGSYHFYPNETGYELRHGSRSVLEVRRDGTEIQVAAGVGVASEAQLELYVRALAPKLLFQLGFNVLHAASVRASRCIAFAGVSGAGKTTTARAFAQAGARPISEDLLIFSIEGGRTEVALTAEVRIVAWARRVASQLFQSPSSSVSADGLGERLLDGPSYRLDEILFLDCTRREGARLLSRALPQPDALITLMSHNFLGGTGVANWRRFFQATSILLQSVEVREATAPAGASLLKAAAMDYMSI